MRLVQQGVTANANTELPIGADYLSITNSSVQAVTSTVSNFLFDTEILNQSISGTWVVNGGTGEITIPSSGMYKVLMFTSDTMVMNACTSKRLWFDDGNGWEMLPYQGSGHNITGGLSNNLQGWNAEERILAFNTVGKIRLTCQSVAGGGGGNSRPFLAIIKLPVRAIGSYFSTGTDFSSARNITTTPNFFSSVLHTEAPGFTITSNTITFTENGIYNITALADNLCSVNNASAFHTSWIEQNVGSGWETIVGTFSQRNAQPTYFGGIHCSIMKAFEIGDQLRFRIRSGSATGTYSGSNLVFKSMRFE